MSLYVLTNCRVEKAGLGDGTTSVLLIKVLRLTTPILLNKILAFHTVYMHGETCVKKTENQHKPFLAICKKADAVCI